MDKIRKLALISLMNLLLVLLFISIAQVRPISISATSAPFFQLPIVFWIVMIMFPPLLYTVAKNNKNPMIPIVCAVFYYFLFYSYGLYFISHPTITDAGSSAKAQEIIFSISHIKNQLNYFTWPVYFVFSKVFTSILGTGPITTLNMGFFSLLLIIPFLTSLFYKKVPPMDDNIRYFILPALYLSLGFYFINEQFVPQFLGLLYLLMLFGCYLRKKNKIYFIFTILFFILCVLTHAFMFVFFLLGIAVEKLIELIKYRKEWRKIIFTPWKTLIIICFIMSIIVILRFDMICLYFHRIINTPNQWKGQTWSILYHIISKDYLGGSRVHPLYYIVPKIYDQIFSIATKGVILISFLIVGLGFLKKRDIFDVGIIAGCVSWFAVGLIFPVILGQRSLQVACIPLSKYFKFPVKQWSLLLSRILLIFILLSPSLFIANDMINLSVEGNRFIQDYNENIAGRFMDQYIDNNSNVLTARNLYPTTYPNGFNRYTPTDLFKSRIKWGEINFVLESPKLQKRVIYLNVSFPTYPPKSIIYSNDIKVVLTS